MIEVYDVSAQEAVEVWQNIRGEFAAWGEYREIANRSLKYRIEESLKDAVERKIGVAWYARSDGVCSRQRFGTGYGCIPSRCVNEEDWRGTLKDAGI